MTVKIADNLVTVFNHITNLKALLRAAISPSITNLSGLFTTVCRARPRPVAVNLNFWLWPYLNSGDRLAQLGRI